MTTKQQPFTAVEEELQEEGYEPGARRRAGSLIDGAAIDAEVCAEVTCPDCGQVGLEYRPFHTSGSYRPFAVCMNCGYWTEF